MSDEVGGDLVQAVVACDQVVLAAELPLKLLLLLLIERGANPLLVALIMAFRLPESRDFLRKAGVQAAPPVQGVAAALFAEARGRTTLLLWVAYFFTQLVLLLMLNWLPSFGYGDGGLKYLILPAVTLGVSPMALLARTTPSCTAHAGMPTAGCSKQSWAMTTPY